MDNLPPLPLTEIEEDIRLIVRNWSDRKQLVALGYLYRLRNCRIDDIPHEIGKALKKEIEEKS